MMQNGDKHKESIKRAKHLQDLSDKAYRDFANTARPITNLDETRKSNKERVRLFSVPRKIGSLIDAEYTVVNGKKGLITWPSEHRILLEGAPMFTKKLIGENLRIKNMHIDALDEEMKNGRSIEAVIYEIFEDFGGNLTIGKLILNVDRKLSAIGRVDSFLERYGIRIEGPVIIHVSSFDFVDNPTNHSYGFLDNIIEICACKTLCPLIQKDMTGEIEKRMNIRALYHTIVRLARKNVSKLCIDARSINTVDHNFTGQHPYTENLEEHPFLYQRRLILQLEEKINNEAVRGVRITIADGVILIDY